MMLLTLDPKEIESRKIQNDRRKKMIFKLKSYPLLQVEIIDFDQHEFVIVTNKNSSWV
jgi:hypothetical protein